MSTEFDNLLAYRRLEHLTRRHFLSKCGLGLGGLWLAGTSGRAWGAAGALHKDPANPLLPAAPHFAPRAKRIIYLHMAGAPSRSSSCSTTSRNSQNSTARSARRNSSKASTSPSSRASRKCSGRSFPSNNTASPARGFPTACRISPSVVDDAVLHQVDAHRPVQPRPGATARAHRHAESSARPSIGAWATYGLGTENQNLPGFIVLISGGKNPRRRQIRLGRGLPALRLSGRAVPLRGRPRALPRQPARHQPRSCRRRARRARPHSTSRSPTEVGDPETLTRIVAIRNGLPHADSRASEAIDIDTGAGVRARDVWHPARQGVLRQQLPARPPPRRARRAFHPALRLGLGLPRRQRQRGAQQRLQRPAARRSTSR